MDLAPQKLRTFSNAVVAAMFVAAIWLPLADSALRLDPGVHLREGDGEAMPALEDVSRHAIGQYPKRFEAYYDKHFGFRGRLVLWHNIVNLFWLNSPLPAPDAITVHSTPTSHDASGTMYAGWKFVMGKDNWLFCDLDGTMEYFRNLRPFTQDSLEQWKSVLEERREWLEERGIRYLFVIVPDKPTIYPENMPRYIRAADRPSRADQFVEYMAGNSEVEVLDLREPIRARKSAGRLYHRNDTHWNDLGAYFGYRQIVLKLSQWFPEMKPAEIGDFQIAREDTFEYNNIADMLGLGQSLPEEAPKMLPAAPRRAVRTQEGVLHTGLSASLMQLPYATVIDDGALPRAVMTHNSFALNVIPFLSENFSRIVYYWQFEFETETILREKPDVVIQQINDWQFRNHSPSNAPMMRK
jgi:alginate O-acetyltransferase complex protein AlgJ